MKIIKRYHSRRGLPLAYHQPARHDAVLTVELSERWAGLYLVHPSGNVSVVTRETFQGYAASAGINIETLWSGDAFNPDHFDSLAGYLRAVACGVSRQIVTGRWVLERHDHGQDGVQCAGGGNPPHRTRKSQGVPFAA